MRTGKFSVIIIVCAAAVLLSGCQESDVKIQNKNQQRRISELQSQLTVADLELDKVNRELETAQAHGGAEMEALSEKVKALGDAVELKNAMIDSLQSQVLGGTSLPIELTTLLEDFANSQEMVTFDANRGIVKFQSDLLFQKGSDIVEPDAAQQVKSLCGILNSVQAVKFDIIIAGHTDDMPIKRSSTLQKHPSNWHLSAHRAISVLEIMVKSGVDSKRLSARGFGEFRPVIENKPGKKGHPQNRRVEIYIIASGM